MNTVNSSAILKQPDSNTFIEVKGFATTPILGAQYGGDDPIQGLMINSLASITGFGLVLLAGGTVIPLGLSAGFGLLMITSDLLLQIKNQKASPIDVDAIEVEETESAQPAAQPIEAPSPVESFQQTVIIETESVAPPISSPATEPTTSATLVDEWGDEAVEEVKAAQSAPDLQTPEQLKAHKFAVKFLGTGRVWSADQLAIKHGMTSEQWCNALGWVATTLAQDYLWNADIKVLVKVR